MDKKRKTVIDNIIAINCRLLKKGATTEEDFESVRIGVKELNYPDLCCQLSLDKAFARFMHITV